MVLYMRQKRIKLHQKLEGFDAAGRVDIYTNSFGISSFTGTDGINEAAHFITISEAVNGKIYKAEFTYTDVPLPDGIEGDTNIGIYATTSDIPPDSTIQDGTKLFSETIMEARKYQMVGSSSVIEDLSVNTIYIYFLIVELALLLMMT